MTDYIEYRVEIFDQNQQEILIALLSESGAEGFEEEKSILKCFVQADQTTEDLLENIIEQNNLKFSKSNIKNKNWNELWEADFKPVVIGDFCSLRACFHPPNTTVKHDIVVTPKMSFGTGHHATTHMMVLAMEGLDFKDKVIFDFGTGTGILSILAEKCGAKAVTAVDNNVWSIENASENFNVNDCSKILLFNAEKIIGNSAYDIILANINRNIILNNLPLIPQHLVKNGVVLFSGLLTGDASIVIEEATRNNLRLVQKFEMNGWICLQMVNH